MSHLRFRGLLTACLSAIALSCTSLAQEIVYDNTRNPLGTVATERLEYGDQLQLSGTARTITDIFFELHGDFTAEGNERGRVRLYTNEKPWDLFRKEPTTLLYESGNFPLRRGPFSYHVSLNVEVPEIITLTLIQEGLEDGEYAGFLLYNPETIGDSKNEFWRRRADGKWEAFLYSLTDPTLKANAAIRIIAVPEPSTWALLAAGGVILACRRSRNPNPR